jgi:hypothetical protein
MFRFSLIPCTTSSSSRLEISALHVRFDYQNARQGMDVTSDFVTSTRRLKWMACTRIDPLTWEASSVIYWSGVPFSGRKFLLWTLSVNALKPKIQVEVEAPSDSLQTTSSRRKQRSDCRKLAAKSLFSGSRSLRPSASQ